MSDGRFTVTLPPPEDPEDPDAPREPGEGSNDTNYDASPDPVNPPTFAGFDDSSSILLIGGAPIDPNAPPSGTTLEQVGSDVMVTTPTGSLVLAGVQLAAWQTAAHAMSLGTAGDDALSLSSYAEIVSTGAGNDTISYHPGDDQVSGGKGADTLDLSQYTSDQVTFGMDGHSITIHTPDGTITLVNQNYYQVGHSGTNIETLQFSDGTLDDAGIRDRAVNDQNTLGDDVVTGTAASNVILGGSGNDALGGSGGTDTFVSTPGNGLDEITDFQDGLELIRFDGGPASFNDLTITEDNGDAVVSDSAGDSIKISGVSAAQLTADDLEFV